MARIIKFLSSNAKTELSPDFKGAKTFCLPDKGRWELLAALDNLRAAVRSLDDPALLGTSAQLRVATLGRRGRAEAVCRCAAHSADLIKYEAVHLAPPSGSLDASQTSFCDGQHCRFG